MKKKTKLFSIAILFLILVMSLTACRKPIADKNGNSLRLTYKEVEEEGRSGLFVLNKDETFSPAPAMVPGFDGATDETRASRYLWYTDADENFSSLIPVVSKDTPLVIIYNATSDIPEKWYVEKYANKGYTIGTHISLGDDKTMYIAVDEALAGTSAAKIFEKAELSGGEYPLNSVSGGSSNLPIENVDTNMRMLLGLEKNKEYTFTFFSGTKLEKVDLIADTAVFQSSKVTQLKTPYKKTDKGYFIINLPYNLDPGYYYLSDLGFFKYAE